MHNSLQGVPRLYLSPEQALWGRDDENVKGRTENLKVQKQNTTVLEEQPSHRHL